MLMVYSSPNFDNQLGRTLLMMACEKGSINLTQHLLNMDVDIHKRDKRRRTALYFAIDLKQEHFDLVCCLLDNGADAKEEYNEKWNPFLKAVDKGHCQIARRLLEQGAILDSSVDNTGALIY
jgi:ankyrin repeat protein